jgi:hypothetical protein
MSTNPLQAIYFSETDAVNLVVVAPETLLSHPYNPGVMAYDVESQTTNLRLRHTVSVALISQQVNSVVIRSSDEMVLKERGTNSLIWANRFWNERSWWGHEFQRILFLVGCA